MMDFVQLAMLFLCGDHTRDSLQIVGYGDGIPVVQQLANRRVNRIPDLENEPALVFYAFAGLRNQPLEDLRARGPSEYGTAWFVFENLAINLFRVTNVGRIRDHEVQGRGRESSQQIGMVKLHTRLQAEAGGVGASNLDRGFGDVGGMNFRIRQFFRERQRNASRASANIHNA